MTKVEAYAGNLHGGGAVVTSAASISAMRALLAGGPRAADLDFVVSSAVSDALLDSSPGMPEVRVVDDRPWSMSRRPPRRPKAQTRLVFFGPDYRFGEADRTICGFADATALAPADSTSAVAAAHSTSRWKASLKRRLLQRYDEYVVQTPSASQRLRNLVGDKPIHVIPNALHPVYFRPAEWEPIELPDVAPGTIRLIYPAGAWPHKNHAIIPQVGRSLAERGVGLQVIVTLDPTSETATHLEDSPYVLNVGRLPVRKLASAYLASDGVFFPSLLETFSTLTIEAQYMGLPVFASDRWYVREVAGDYPIYFDPMRPSAAADAIADHYAEFGSKRTLDFEPGTIRQEYRPEVQAARYLALLD